MTGGEIRLEDVSLDRGDTRVLHALRFALTERRIGIVGDNGSGKSSLARLFNALLLPTRGRVLVDGLDSASQAKAIRRRVGFLFQNPDNQVVYPTVGEDVAFGLKRLRLTPAETASRVGAALARFGLQGSEDRLVHQLSGGERQMVALAGVMVMEPGWLVLDEPTAFLDRRNRSRLLAHLARIESRIILVTHDLEALEAFDRVLVLEGGRLVADAPPAEALAYYRKTVE